MSRRFRHVGILVAVALLALSACGNSADPETWEQAEQDDRFESEEFAARSAVEHNFMMSCIEANTESLTAAEAQVLCECSFDGLRAALTLQQFQRLDDALRADPNPSDLDEEPEDLWDDVAEDILRSCARRVDT